MAAADYRLCDICSAKTFYDAELDYDPAYGPLMLPRLGDWKVICTECAKTHEVVIQPKPATPSKD